MLCYEVGFYPIDTRDSLKGFSKVSDIFSPALCFKTFRLVAAVEHGLQKEGARCGIRTRREVTRKPPWAQWKEIL